MTAPQTGSATGYARAGLAPRVREILGLSVALLTAFLIVNLVHFRVFEVSVILYACIVDAIVASALVFGPYLWLRRMTTPLLGTEIALTAIAGNLMLLLYSVMGPTVIDRSLSIYIVEKIDQRGGAIAETAMPKIILTEYMAEFRVPEVRMTEQVTSGTVTIIDGCIRLTPRGKLVADMTRLYRAHLLPHRRKVGGEITDALTKPYENARVLVPFACPARTDDARQLP